MVILMPDEENEEDDWTSYANVGFGSTDYSLWESEDQQSKVMVEPEWDDDYQLQINESCLLYTSPSPRDVEESRMPSSA